MHSNKQEEYGQDLEIIVTDLGPLNPVKTNRLWMALATHRRPLLWFALAFVSCAAILTFVLALYPGILPRAPQQTPDTSALRQTLHIFNQKVVSNGVQVAYIQFSANTAITSDELNFLHVVDENVSLFHGIKTYHSQLIDVSQTHATALLTWTLQGGPDLSLQTNMLRVGNTWKLLNLSYAHPGSEEVFTPQPTNRT
jgi:hypothetical protein